MLEFQREKERERELSVPWSKRQIYIYIYIYICIYPYLVGFHGFPISPGFPMGMMYSPQELAEDEGEGPGICGIQMVSIFLGYLGRLSQLPCTFGKGLKPEIRTRNSLEGAKLMDEQGPPVLKKHLSRKIEKAQEIQQMQLLT